MDINLLPQESVVERYYFSISTIATCSLLVISTVLAILSFFINQDNKSKHVLAQALQSRIQQNQVFALQLREKIPAQTTAASNGVLRAIEMIQAIHHVRDMATTSATLTNVSVTGPTLTLQGSARTLGAVADVLRKVRRVSHVQQALLGTVSHSGNGVSFTMLLTMQEGPTSS